MKRKIAMLVSAAALTLALTACGGGNKSASPSPSSAPAAGSASPAATTAAANAESIYKQNCVSCHGADLGGKMGPNLQKVGGKLDKDKITAKIQNGGGGMPSYKSKLKDEEIQALGDWLSAKK
ncbi:c-type cytochrome [Paenibacillus sp. MBLB4367]|uniref:c-type cytochrome n=1 Tax=Paenibacillus sp. MBLB4367 TaxID=3384767 RepID=UPI003907E9E8